MTRRAVGCAKPDRHAAVAMSYGAPGVAAEMVLAVQVMGRTDWRDIGLAVARNAALRPRDNIGVVDGGLCHGGG